MKCSLWLLSTPCVVRLNKPITPSFSGRLIPLLRPVRVSASHGCSLASSTLLVSVSASGPDLVETHWLDFLGETMREPLGLQSKAVKKEKPNETRLLHVEVALEVTALLQVGQTSVTKLLTSFHATPCIFCTGFWRGWKTICYSGVLLSKHNATMLNCLIIVQYEKHTRKIILCLYS